MDTSRVVEVLHDQGPNGEPRWLLGSGFVVGDGLVLTAAHNVGEPGAAPGPRGTVVRALAGDTIDGTVLVRSDEVDMALLNAPGLMAEAIAVGRLDREHWIVVRDVQSVGFPEYKYDEDAPIPHRRSAAHVFGEIPSVEDYASGDLTLKIVPGAPPPGSSLGESPWEGMSGAGVALGDCLLGIAVEHRLKEGAGSLRVAPLTRLADAPKGAQFSALLGIDDAAGLPLVGGAQSEARVQDVSAAPSMPAYVIEESLPADVKTWTGREHDLEWLESVLSQGADAGPSIAVVVGLGGVGKSALAIRAAYRLQERFPDGHLYVDLRGADAQALDPAVVLDDFLRILGMPGNAIPSDVGRRTREYRARLAGKRMLVVLDNAAGSEQLKPLLPTSLANAVIVTSRAFPDVLAGVPARKLEVLEVGEAVELLGRLSGADRVVKEPEAAARIARYCGYLPIALRTVAARLGASRRTLASMADELADERARLKRLSAHDLDVRASFELSYRGLSGDEQLAFRRLGLLYSSDFTPWRLAALLDCPPAEADALLWRLEEAQMLDYWRDDLAGQPRFRLHDLLRVFAGALAEEESPQERAGQTPALARAGETFLALAALAAESLEPGQARTPDPGAAARWHMEDDALERAIRENPVTWFSAERASLGSAILRMHDAGLSDVCWRLTECLVGFFDVHSHWDDWERTHELALEAAEQAGNPHGVATTLRHLGRLRRYEDRMDEAATLLADSRDRFAGLRDAAGEVATLVDVIRLEWFRGRYSDALAAYARATELLDVADDLHARGRLHNSIGLVYHDVGRWAEAHDAFASALAVFEPLGDRRWTGASLWGIGLACRSLGRFDEGVRRLEEAMRVLGEVGNRRWQAVCLRGIGGIHRDLGQWQAAETELRGGLKILEEVGDRYWRPVLRLSLADVHRAQGRHDDATAELDAVLAELADRKDAARRIGVALATRGRLRLDQRRFADARVDLDDALERFAEQSDPVDQGRALTSLGHVCAACGERDAAQKAWERALERFDALGYWQAPPVRRLLHWLRDDGIVLSPAAVEVLDELDRLGGRPVDEIPPTEARAQAGLGIAVERLLSRAGQQRPPRPMDEVAERVLRHRDAHVDALVYRPATPGPLPVVLFLHGGGWVLDDHASYDPVARKLATDVPAVVVYVRYRLAPEHPFPAALDDTLTSLAWAREHAAEVGGDPHRIAFAGQSAGGNLALAACLRLRDAGDPVPSAQLLVYPVCDRRFDTPSYRQFETAPSLSSRAMRWFWSQYLADERDGADPLASPLRAADLSGLPPTRVITAEVDPLRDEGRRIAERLIADGVDATADHVEHVMHGFFALVDVLPEADAACDVATAHLRAALGGRVLTG